ncbi:MAG: hypothetical protein V3R76_00225 [Gammaproteobacteria bacterium]
MSIDQISGYKPVRHRGCGGQIAWVKDEVQPSDRMIASDALYLDGSNILPHSPIDIVCQQCGHRIISPTAFKI